MIRWLFTQPDQLSICSFSLSNLKQVNLLSLLSVSKMLADNRGLMEIKFINRIWTVFFYIMNRSDIELKRQRGLVMLTAYMIVIWHHWMTYFESGLLLNIWCLLLSNAPNMIIWSQKCLLNCFGSRICID